MDKQKAGKLETVLNLVNIAIGAGVLSFPYGFQLGGYIWTMILIALCASVACFTLIVLVRSCNHFDASSYQQLMRNSAGSFGEIFTMVWMVGIQFGATTAYLIIIFDTLNPVLEYWSGTSSNLTEREFIIPMFAAFIILPLCLLRSLKALAPASLIAVGCVALASFTIVYRGIETIAKEGIAEGCCELQAPGAPWEDLFVGGGDCDDVEDDFATDCGCCHDSSLGDERIAAFAVGTDFFAPIGIVVFALNNTIQAPSVFAEIKDPLEDANHESGVPLLHGEASGKEESKKRREQVMRSSIYIAMVIIASFYLIVGIFGYLQFGEDVKSNVLVSYKQGDDFVNVARLCIACLVSTSFPVLQFVGRSMIHDITSPVEKKGSTMPLWKHVLLTFMWVGSAVALSINLEDLGVVVDFIGSTAGVLAMFICPGFMLMVPNGPYAEESSPEGTYIQKRRNRYFYAGCGEIAFGMAVIVIRMFDIFGDL